MLERAIPLFRKGVLVFDHDTIVWAALRAYIEASLDGLVYLSFPACDRGWWEGDLDRGAFLNFGHSPDFDVIAWDEVGVVGLAYELGCGPVEQLDLEPDAVTGGPDDVRAAVPDLPEELEAVFVRAVSQLDVNTDQYGEKLAGAGFWLYGDRAGGNLFDKYLSRTHGVKALAAWGLLDGIRLRRLCCENHLGPDEPEEVPNQEIIDAVIERVAEGPTEFTPAELETILLPNPDPKKLLEAQRMLQKVGITWPGSPKLPDEPPEPNPRYRDTGVSGPFSTTTVHSRNSTYRTYFDRDAIVRAALRAYIENIFAQLDPLDRHPFAASFVPQWTGDLQRGAFRNGDTYGSYEVMAWSDVGVVGLAYEHGYGPIEHLALPIDAVQGGPDDVRVAVTEMPAELEPTLEMAVSLLDVGAHGEKLASVGCWLHGELAGGSLYEYYIQKGVERLRAWGKLKGGRLRRWYRSSYVTLGSYVMDLGRTKAEPIQTLVDAVTSRAIAGPTELTPDELATLCPTPPEPQRLLDAQRSLQKVGITWPDA